MFRKPKFDNWAKNPVDGHKKWFGPSIQHKLEIQARLFREFCNVVPVTSAVFEMGKDKPEPPKRQ